MSKIVCKICVLQKGLKGSELFAGDCPYAFDTQEELNKHLHDEHGFAIDDGKGICVVCGKPVKENERGEEWGEASGIYSFGDER